MTDRKNLIQSKEYWKELINNSLWVAMDCLDSKVDECEKIADDMMKDIFPIVTELAQSENRFDWEKHNENLKKRLEAFDEVLKNTPKEELDAMIKEVDGLNIEGPTLDEYFNGKQKVTKSNLFNNRTDLWKEHHKEESERLRDLLIARGFISCGIGDAEGLWMSYSDDYAAGWLGMPDDDNDLYECIKDRLCHIETVYLG